MPTPHVTCRRRMQLACSKPYTTRCRRIQPACRTPNTPYRFKRANAHVCRPTGVSVLLRGRGHAGARVGRALSAHCWRAHGRLRPHLPQHRG
eukprot:2170532-Rhodomonas_salina.1